MFIKAKRMDNLEKKVSEYKNKLAVKYLKQRGYECDESKKSMAKVNSILRSQHRKVVFEIKDEIVSRSGAYYTWEAHVRAKIIDVVTRKEV